MNRFALFLLTTFRTMKSGYFLFAFLMALCTLLELISSEQIAKKLWWHKRRRSRRRCHPQNCEVSNWCNWSHCSATCGGYGQQMRSRKIIRIQKCGGRCDHNLVEYRHCNTANVCLNGGVWRGNSCRCNMGYTGKCCESKNKGKVFNNIVSLP